ncbi:MAG: hypothetical protein JWP97_277 [Labilithrix sp.]|nr:hypothetical protein [Labilithrix sp.]
MRLGTMRTPSWSLAAFGLAVTIGALAGCGSSEDPNSIGTPGGSTPGSTTDPNGTATAQTPAEQVKEILDARKVDYGEALRTASLKLTDELPALADIKAIDGAADDAAKKAIYEKAVDTMIASPKFTLVMRKYFMDMFKTAQVGAVQMGASNKDGAANFAAQVVTEGRSYNELFTATANTCPTFDATTGAFTPAECMKGPAGGTTVGVLTDPGLQSQYFSNMAFRRVRFIQETFACSKFPAEFSKTPTAMGNGTYTNPQAFDGITGKTNTPTARIDFQDTSAVICANCHGTLNHIAPLFINYDEKGLLQATSQVEVPIPGNPKAAVKDYQPGTPFFAWRKDKNFDDLTGLGAQMAADPEVGRCAVNRAWNYALSRGDIVNDLATIPTAVTDQLAKDFTSGGQKLKETLRVIFKSEDFTKF